jgi:hypothetical protein
VGAIVSSESQKVGKIGDLEGMKESANNVSLTVCPIAKSLTNSTLEAYNEIG